MPTTGEETQLAGPALNYISEHPVLDEIIFSGGDPLMTKDHEMEAIPHIKRLD